MGRVRVHWPPDGGRRALHGHHVWERVCKHSGRSQPLRPMRQCVQWRRRLPSGTMRDQLRDWFRKLRGNVPQPAIRPGQLWGLWAELFGQRTMREWHVSAELPCWTSIVRKQLRELTK